MTNIFEYSNIFDPNIYSDIRSYRNFNTNIFGYSFVSKMFIRIYSDIRSYHFLDTNIFGYPFISKSIRMSHSGLVALFNSPLGQNSMAYSGFDWAKLTTDIDQLIFPSLYKEP